MNRAWSTCADWLTYIEEQQPSNNTTLLVRRNVHRATNVQGSTLDSPSGFLTCPYQFRFPKLGALKIQ